MGKKIDQNKRFVKDGPSIGATAGLYLIFAIVVIGGIVYYVLKNHSDVFSLPTQAEIAKIHSEEKKLR